MSYNIMNEYIKLTKKSIKSYIELMCGGRFDREIFNSYLDAYMDVRYYDLNENKLHKILKEHILQNIKTQKEKLMQIFEEKKEKVEIIGNFFNYIIYLDNVIPYKNIEKVVEDIYEEKIKFSKTDEKTFKDEMYKKINDHNFKIENLFKRFETDEFYLRLTNYKSISNVQRVNLKYNFKLPELYNILAIEKAFTTGITNEDKLFVEYYLISIYIINDIIKGNFRKQYIVEFASTLIDKPQKVESVLNIINNSAIQDKLSLKIKYDIFIENKEKTYELIKRGFRFAIIIDNTFEAEFEDIEKLDVFSYILVNSNFKDYNKLIKNRKILNKIIEL